MLKSKIMLICGFSVLCLPLVLFILTGEAAHELDGELDYERPRFSIASFYNGTFQQNFENWFSTKHPLRHELVELYGILDAGKDRLSAAASNADDEPAGYRGNDQVIIGRQGWLFENGYINEYFGFAEKYINVTDGELLGMVSMLKSIQEFLSERNIAFCVVITPSKASALPQYIPAWYTARFAEPTDYIRPYVRFARYLGEYGVYHIDSAALYEELNLTEIFPKTGTHWTKTAALETCRAMVAEYQRQTEGQSRQFYYDEIIRGQDPPGFGNGEKDIFGIVYAGKRSELENAVTDEFYCWPDVYTDTRSPIPHITVQGGSFTADIAYYFAEYGIASEVNRIHYNNGGNIDIVWPMEIERTGFIILEVNEQFVYNVGGNAPAFGLRDFRGANRGNNIIAALYEHLKEDVR
jgi:hypothetical protein